MSPRIRAALRLLASPQRLRMNLQYRLLSVPSQARHIFVLGPPRSGSTLAQVLIAAHSNLATCDSETGIFTHQDLFSTGRRYAGLSEATVVELLSRYRSQVEFFDAVADRVVAEQGGTRFVEKTPQHVKHLRRLLRLYPEARFVFTYRDGRDCYCSAQSHAWIPQREDLASFARYWRKLVRARLEVESDRIIDVGYEDLTADPHAWMGRIMTFVGEDFEVGQLDHTRRTKDSRSRDEAFQKIDKPVDTRSQGRYRRELPPPLIAEFERIAGEELRTLGYSLVNSS